MMNIEDSYFSEDLYQNLPKVLKKATNVFNNRRERDIALLSHLLTLSIYFPDVWGTYRGKRTSTNLFGMIIAPPASGKGAMVYAKKAVEKIEEAYFRGKTIDPKFQPSLFIPGNTSQSAFINKLNANSGKGIFFETEADTIADTFKQEWGDFSKLLREGFSGEGISKLRVGEENETVVKNPMISACISGTPNQVLNLISSVENGLFSRFVYYYFDEATPFEDPRPVPGKVDLDTYFENIGYDLLDIYNHIGGKEINVTFSNSAWDDLVDYFRDMKYQLMGISKDFEGVVKRYGLIFYRIAMLLTIIRHGELKTSFDDEIEVDGQSFAAAVYIIFTLFEHVQEVHGLYRINKNELLPMDLKNLHDRLPKNVSLKTDQICESWKSFGFGQRSAYIRIKKLVKAGLLFKQKNNQYIAYDQNHPAN